MWLKAPVGGMPLRGFCLATSDPPRASPWGAPQRPGVGQKWVVKKKKINTLLANLSSISENSSLPAESKMKSSWDQKSSCQNRTPGGWGGGQGEVFHSASCTGGLCGDGLRMPMAAFTHGLPPPRPQRDGENSPECPGGRSMASFHLV